MGTQKTENLCLTPLGLFQQTASRAAVCRTQPAASWPGRTGRRLAVERLSRTTEPRSFGEILRRLPFELPHDWRTRVNRAQSSAAEAALRRSIQRGSLYGSEHWTKLPATRLHSTPDPREDRKTQKSRWSHFVAHRPSLPHDRRRDLAHDARMGRRSNHRKILENHNTSLPNWG